MVRTLDVSDRSCCSSLGPFRTLLRYLITVLLKSIKATILAEVLSGSMFIRSLAQC